MRNRLRNRPDRWTCVVLTLVILILGVGAAIAIAAGSSPSFSFSSDEPGITFTCQLDGGAASACASPKAYANLAPGAHSETIIGAFTVPNPPPPSTVLLGDQNVEATGDTSTAPASEAFGFTARQSGTATSASVYLTSTDGATVGLYADASGKPGALLDKGSIASNAAGWVTVPLNGATAITSGTRYWIAVGGNSGGKVTYRDHGSTGTSFDFSGSGFADPYGSNGQWSSNPISAYVSGAAATSTSTSTTSTSTTSTTTTPAPTGLHVSGAQLQDAAGNVVRLHGVGRSGTEYACIQGWGIFDGPSDQASITAIKSWHANSVRVYLNEDCWLGINGVNSAYGGANYQTAIVNYVHLIEQNGLIPIVTLMWSAPGTTQATAQIPMPDRDHSPAFWQGVASAFKSDPNVIFDLFNEPYPDSNQDTTAAWTCWRDGGTCPGVSYPVAGMQELVNTVRGTGAQNVLLLGGVQYANALGNWMAYEPTDPAHQLAAAFHTYQFTICSNVTCWDNTIAPLATHVPVITGELGESDNSGNYIASFMSWADPKGISYIGNAWDAWGCNNGNIALIADYSGTPCTPFGSTYQSHLTSTFP